MTDQKVNAPVKRAAIKRLSFWESIDLPLAVIVVSLFAIGLLMIYSASWQLASSLGNSEYRMVLRQMLIGLVGLGSIIVLTYIDYHKYEKWIVPGMIAVVVLCVGVLLFGQETQFGARRGLFSGSIQPSEFAKLAVIVYLSFWLYSKRDSLDKWTYGLIPLLGIIGIIAGLVLAQPDVSAAATIIFLGGVLFFIAGGKVSQILMVVVITGLLGMLVVRVYPTASTRLTDYWLGLQDPKSASDHVKWSLEAIINGGVFGVGIGRSTTKFIGLPVAPTDSIFAVIVEETGLIGGFVVISLFILLLWRGLTVANRAQDDLGKWLAAGISLWIFIEAVINMGVLVNLLPFAGNALPLISSGGSSLITTLAGIGILMGISRQSKLTQSGTERNLSHAVVDLRRRDRRGSVSRARGPASGN